jgi:hypothetical protein
LCHKLPSLGVCFTCSPSATTDLTDYSTAGKRRGGVLHCGCRSICIFCRLSRLQGAEVTRESKGYPRKGLIIQYTLHHTHLQGTTYFLIRWASLVTSPQRDMHYECYCPAGPADPMLTSVASSGLVVGCSRVNNRSSSAGSLKWNNRIDCATNCLCGVGVCRYQ